jgi:tetratricopeptide (TPR) repeat protein
MGLVNRLTRREQLWITAIVEDRRGNREQAIESYRIFLAQYPDDVSGWFRLGYVYLITQRPEKSIEAFERVMEIDPVNGAAQVNIASCLNSMRDRMAENMWLFVPAQAFTRQWLESFKEFPPRTGTTLSVDGVIKRLEAPASRQ